MKNKKSQTTPAHSRLLIQMILLMGAFLFPSSIFTADTTIDGSLTVNSNMLVHGTSSMVSNVVVGRTLTVSNSTSLLGSLSVSGATTLTNITINGTLTGNGTSSALTNFGALYLGEAKFGTDANSNMVFTLDSFYPAALRARYNDNDYIQMDRQPGTSNMRLFANTTGKMIIGSDEAIKFESDDVIFEWGYWGASPLMTFDLAGSYNSVSNGFGRGMTFYTQTTGDSFVINNTTNGAGSIGLGQLLVVRRKNVDYFTVMSNGMVSVSGYNPKIEINGDANPGGGSESIGFVDFTVPRGLIGFASNSTDFVYRSGANCFTNGNERLRIASTGNVGIGTNAPSALLHVNGTARFESTVYISPQGGISMGAYTNQ